MLAGQAHKPRGGCESGVHIAPLKGKLFDETGDHLTPLHTKKDGRAIHYYISNRLIRAKDPTGWRLPARAIEEAVASAVCEHIERARVEMRVFKGEDIAGLESLHDGFNLEDWSQAELLDLIERVDLSKTEIVVMLSALRLAELTGSQSEQINPDALEFSTSMRIRKRGVQSKLILGSFEVEPNANLLETLAMAHNWLEAIKSGRSISEIAKDRGLQIDYLRKRIGLAMLSPKIQKAIAIGQHPDHWSVSMFIKSDIPNDWQSQDALFLS